MLVHFGFEHLLDGSGKEALQLLLDVACGFTLGHKHPGELHFFFTESVVSLFHGWLFSLILFLELFLPFTRFDIQTPFL